ncbi:MAG: MATE family efflux transporter [Oscillospiraceae bacterium]|nr:MATE family efflux transporter [Oscillospiraceae bacterium]
MSETKLIRDYTRGPVMRQMLTFACPFMLSNLLQTAYNLVDMAVVGQYLGAAGLSAVSVGGDLIHIYTFIAMGFCNAGQILISQYIGLRNKKAVSETVGLLFTFTVFLSVVLTLIGVCFNSIFLRWLNVPPDAYDYCYSYTMCCTLGIIFMCGYQLIGSILRGMGNSRHPLIFIVIATVINTALDILLVSHGWGAFGAAVATVIAQGVSLLLSIIFLARHKVEFGFDFRLKSFFPKQDKLRLLCKLGIPLTLQSSAISISMMAIMGFINVYGVIASAVTGVGFKISSVTSVVTLALSQCGGTMVGQNFTAGKFERVKKIQYASYIIGLSFAALLSTAVILWPEKVFSLFDDSPEVLSMSRTYVPVAVINILGFALRAPGLALCNGLGFASMNFVLGMMDGVVLRIGLSILLGITLGMGIYGFWYGSAIALLSNKKRPLSK